MPNFRPVSKISHAGKSWLPASGYAFAREQGVLPLGLNELPKATPSLPIAFVRHEKGYQPVAMMGIHPNTNHYVLPNGKWLTNFVPASADTYPFKLLTAADGRKIVCVDEDSGLVTDEPDGKAFFEGTGTVSPAFQAVLDKLNRNEQALVAATQACGVLAQHQLIKPWLIKLQSEDGEVLLDGFFQADEEALNQVSGDVLVQLRDAGALILAYCQLLSMQHIHFLGQLASAHAKTQQAKVAADTATKIPNELNLEFLKSSDSLDFGSFR